MIPSIIMASYITSIFIAYYMIVRFEFVGENHDSVSKSENQFAFSVFWPIMLIIWTGFRITKYIHRMAYESSNTGKNEKIKKVIES